MAGTLPLGHRIRGRRIELGLGQAAVAATVGISPSYLNLIEHNRRAIGGALLLRLAQALGLDSDALSGREESRLVGGLLEMAADPALPLGWFDRSRAADLVGGAPDLARAALAAYGAFLEARDQAQMLSERLAEAPFLTDTSHQLLTLITSIRSFSEILQDYGDIDAADRQRFIAAIAGESSRLSELAVAMLDFLGGGGSRKAQRTPDEEIEDLLHDHSNHFPSLEAAAAQHRQAMDPDVPLLAALMDRLQECHGVAARIVPSTTVPGGEYWCNPAGAELLLSDGLSPASRRFQTARLLGRLSAAAEIDAELTGVSSPQALERGRGALASAFAGALLFPYDVFAAAAHELRYDIERLEQRFSASFEQICHRLASLRRPGGDTIPMHFLRTDIAGNISKRFSGSGLRLPRYSGACPRWICHTAFLTPGRIVTQLAEMPDGTCYMFVAKATVRPGGGFRAAASNLCVMVGWDVALARQTVYADGLDLAAAEGREPVGISCRLCPRQDCRQRVRPAIETIRKS